ncbi:hypothetical protein [Mariniblastus fucicola]|uniref:Uncharacterized protein n=1 Tax=Mariniblastus fucicola TaxID=980251 RepID=A0A5B9PEC1_9BACT|nr:hypothetical protein [Mariniblastus fucicola]QEG23849.1 hypothetical protein MFFC18_37530 [Mariniblastus fucicola]
MKFDTRLLLAVTAWAALCYAMAFSIPPNLLAFYAVKFITVVLVFAGAMLPLVVELKHREFWIGWSSTTLSLIAFMMMGGVPNPVAEHVTNAVFRMMGHGDLDVFADYGENFARGTIGSWVALYWVVELHTVLLWGVVAGLIWMKLGEQSPGWLLGVWSFFWALSFAMEWFGVGVGWSVIVWSMVVVCFASMLPCLVLYGGRMRPFWITVAIGGILVCVQIMSSKSYGLPIVANTTIANTFPNLAFYPEIGSLIVLLSVPLAAVTAGLITQTVAWRSKKVGMSEDRHSVSSTENSNEGDVVSNDDDRNTAEDDELKA